MVTNNPDRWLLFIYSVPREPSANRVSVWRKLKRLGAIMLQDSIWVLPDSPRTAEQFQWLASDISDLGGQAQVWQGSLCLDGHDEALVQQFLAHVDGLYGEILAALEGPEPDLKMLARRYRQARLQDYFRSPLGERVRQGLLSVGGRTKR